MDTSLLAIRYQQEREGYVKGLVACWDIPCKGHLTILEKPEPYEHDDKEYLRVARCDKCGQGWSFFTFAQWVENRRGSARYAIEQAMKDRLRAKESYKREMAEAKKNHEERMARIREKVEDARATLAEIEEAKRRDA